MFKGGKAFIKFFKQPGICSGIKNKAFILQPATPPSGYPAILVMGR